MKVAIHQPQYFPYPGFFHKLMLSEALVFMDDTQYDRRFTNRNRILDTHGALWLTVPIEKADKFLPNKEVRINNRLEWRHAHWKKILVSYANSPHFGVYAGELKEFYDTVWSSLMDLDLETMRKVMEWLGIRIPVIMESALEVSSAGTQRLVDICLAMGADTYVSGRGAGGYLDEALFRENGLRVEYSDYSPTPYPQRFSQDFVPDLSILDVLFNVGRDSAGLVARSAAIAPRM